jgi:hypothetical protein
MNNTERGVFTNLNAPRASRSQQEGAVDTENKHIRPSIIHLYFKPWCFARRVPKSDHPTSAVTRKQVRLDWMELHAINPLALLCQYRLSVHFREFPNYGSAACTSGSYLLTIWRP